MHQTLVVTILRNDERYSSLMVRNSFRLDVVILLRANEAKLWGTSIYSYVEACWCTLLLHAHVGHADWLSDVRCGHVDAACVGSTSDLHNLAVRYNVCRSYRHN